MNSFSVELLDSIVNGTWSVNNDTGLIDVEGDVFIGYDNDTLSNPSVIPFDFGEVSGDFVCGIKTLIDMSGFPIKTGGRVKMYYNSKLKRLNWNPIEIGICLCIDFKYIPKENYHIIIPEIEELISRGIELLQPDIFYYPYKDAYYNAKIIELL
jgi:hypothetical protein